MCYFWNGNYSQLVSSEWKTYCSSFQKITSHYVIWRSVIKKMQIMMAQLLSPLGHRIPCGNFPGRPLEPTNFSSTPFIQNFNSLIFLLSQEPNSPPDFLLKLIYIYNKLPKKYLLKHSKMSHLNWSSNNEIWVFCRANKMTL